MSQLWLGCTKPRLRYPSGLNSEFGVFTLHLEIQISRQTRNHRNREAQLLNEGIEVSDRNPLTEPFQVSGLGGVGMPQCTCEGQKATVWSQFSPFTVSSGNQIQFVRLAWQVFYPVSHLAYPRCSIFF